MSGEISGIHYVTVIAGEPQRNVDFYAGQLSLRMVKKTLNFDDLGKLKLPPWLEPRRERLAEMLPPLRVPTVGSR